MNLIKYFPKVTTELTFAESLILRYLGDNIDQIDSLTITKVAADNNVSTTTVVRLCKKLGVQKFSRLKITLEKVKNDLAIEAQSSDFNINFKYNFKSTLKGNLPDKVQNPTQLIKEKQQIFIFAIGLTTACGQYLNLALQQLGKNCSFISDHQIIWSLDQLSTTDGLAIFISNSGESQELVQLIQRIKNADTLTTLSIVNTPNSTLGRLSDVALHGYSQPLLINTSDFTPHFSIFLILDLIIQQYIQTSDNKKFM